MKLILSSYLRMLKERDELDILLPDLLICMGLVPLTKPQTGTRQFGVDLSATGPDAEDKGKQKLFLFVLKQGDIGRATWDGNPQAVRPSLDEIFDVYLRSHVSATHKDLPIKIVVCTTGDLKEEIKANWSGYTNDNKNRAELDFWGADQLASLLERHMLDEHIFSNEDRVDLRRALALVSENDYALRDFHRLLLRQLGLDDDGRLIEVKVKPKALKKALTRINMATRVLATWALEEGNGKQALFAAERALLWAWHRVQQVPDGNIRPYHPELAATWHNYKSAAKAYFERIQGHCYVKDSLSGYARDNAVQSVTLMEHIGLISAIGLAHSLHIAASPEDRAAFLKNANIVADGLNNFIKNNPTACSPRLDSNAIDITLAMMLLYATGRHAAAVEWLREMVKRLDYTFKINRCFPIDEDSADNLAAFEAGELDEEEIGKLKATSWLLPTLAGWCVIFEQPDVYNVLVNLQSEACKGICKQLWHPSQDVFKWLYFKIAHYVSGESEAPIVLPANMDEYRQRMQMLLQSERHNILSVSPAAKAGILPIDFIASRHFRTFVAPFYWYKLSSNASSAQEEALPDPHN